ncbi:MAG: hypothetical protein EOP43_07035 [Sphingobacteriaceae bacterium]|nr:MAG: hypothetical protein EOP43_07035 [Sphingobacteriaceae bacterium]
MKYIVLFCCLFYGVESYSQNSENPVNILQEFFADKLPITYADTIHQYDLKYLKEALNKGTLYDSFFLLKQKSDDRQLILTKEEKKYLLEKIDEQQDFIWPNNLFHNSQKNNIQEKNSINKSKNFFQTVFSFSKPILIRNNSIGIFYYAYYCGGECGQGSIEIYRKSGTKWTRWISIIQWIS